MTPHQSPTWCGRLFGDHLMNWSQGQWRSCCKMPWDTVQSHGESPWQTDLINQRRTAALTGQRHADCASCWQEEDRGLPSFRQTAASSKIMNRFILNLGNTCNLACTYCYSGNSSMWANKTGNPPRIPDDILLRQETFWKWWKVEKHRIERLVISGGEPSLMSEMYAWIDRADISGKEILFNTNAASNHHWWSRFLSKLDELSNDNRIIIRVSMDAVGDRFEWIRTGLSWGAFERNMRELGALASAKNLLVRVSPTVSCLTLGLELLELLLLEFYSLMIHQFF